MESCLVFFSNRKLLYLVQMYYTRAQLHSIHMFFWCVKLAYTEICPNVFLLYTQFSRNIKIKEIYIL